MERRELYEPEDIEQLLFERSYDDLLEEERAFVLRHLSGRAEYEAMRALLLRVHEDEGTATVPDADPVVRDRVLAAFRAEQRPQWRIWLNSIGAAFWPKNAPAFWRPALAFGSVALLVTVGVWGYRNWERQATAPAFAEVRATPRHKAVPQAPATQANERANDSSVAGYEVRSGTYAPSAPVALEQPLTTTAADEPASEANNAPGEVAFVPPAAAAQAPGSTAYWTDAAKDDAAQQGADRKSTKFGTAAEGSVAGFTALDSTGPIQSGLMDRHDLYMNASTANATGTYKQPALADVEVLKEKQRTATRSRREKKAEEEEAGTDVTALVGLLRAAW